MGLQEELTNSIINQITSIQASVGVFFTLRSKLLEAKKVITSDDKELSEENSSLLKIQEEREKALYTFLPKLSDIKSGKMPSSAEDWYKLSAEMTAIYQAMNDSINKVSSHISKVEQKYNIKITIEKFESKMLNIFIILMVALTSLYFGRKLR